jgi:hypothetical protein
MGRAIAAIFVGSAVFQLPILAIPAILAILA